MADAPSPSPYAPGIIADERLPPRPPGRAIVFLAAKGVMAIVASELWRFVSVAATAATGQKHGRRDAILVAGLVTLPSPLWAYLSDRLPLLGMRREGLLLLTFVTMVAVWVAVAVGSERYAFWLLASVPAGLASAISSAAVDGGLTEIGRRRAATGRLSAAHTGIATVAPFVVLPLALTSPSITSIAGIAAGLALSMVLLIVLLAGDDTRPGPPATALEARVSVPRFLFSRSFWSLVPLLAFSFAAIPPSLLDARIRAAQDGIGASTMQRASMTAPVILAAIAYALFCRRFPLRSSLRVILLLKVLVLVASRRVLLFGETTELEVTLMVLRGIDALVNIALFDLAMRAAPPGREASGIAWLLGARAVIGIVWARLIFAASADGSLSVSGADWIAAGESLAAVLAVSLLPRAIVETRDGQVVRSPA